MSKIVHGGTINEKYQKRKNERKKSADTFRAVSENICIILVLFYTKWRLFLAPKAVQH
jgi:hypothetical protein